MQTVDGGTKSYTVDPATDSTEALQDGMSTYLYGVGRVGEQQPGEWQYHLGDGLGSVRQLTDASGNLTLAKSYKPYGEGMNSESGGSRFKVL